jgi:hypothetical protein
MVHDHGSRHLARLAGSGNDSDGDGVSLAQRASVR